MSWRDLLGGAARVEGGSPLNVVDYANAIVQSGFPAVMSNTLRGQRELPSSYLKRVIDRDLPGRTTKSGTRRRCTAGGAPSQARGPG